jgi:hypothetical protein
MAKLKKKKATKLAKSWQKVVKSCQKVVKNCQKVVIKLSKSCQKAVKSCQKVVKKLSKLLSKLVIKNSETGRRRKRRRRRRRRRRIFVAPRPGTTLSHLVKSIAQKKALLNQPFTVSATDGPLISPAEADH